MAKNLYEISRDKVVVNLPCAYTAEDIDGYIRSLADTPCFENGREILKILVAVREAVKNTLEVGNEE